MQIFFIVLFLSIPAGLIWLCHHQAWANKIGIVVLCYAAGLVAGNTGLIPPQVLPVQQAFTDISILLALPLLLFTLDIRQWSRVAGKAILSMVFATTAVVTLATSLFFVFRGQGVEAASHFAAMSVGVYTGGTPNLAAIKTGLDIPHSEYIVFHSLDTLVGTTYLLMMLTVGVRLFRKLLNRPIAAAVEAPDEAHHFDSDDYTDLLRRDQRGQIAKAAALSVAVVGASLGLAQLLAAVSGQERSSAAVIVALTTFGIVLSLVPGVRKLQVSYKLGMYLIYVFCFVVASMAGLENLARVDATVGRIPVRHRPRQPAATRAVV